LCPRLHGGSFPCLNWEASTSTGSLYRYTHGTAGKAFRKIAMKGEFDD
jgi:hypothetical protein